MITETSLKCSIKQVHRCCRSHADGQCIPRCWSNNGERTFSEFSPCSQDVQLMARWPSSDIQTYLQETFKDISF